MAGGCYPPIPLGAPVDDRSDEDKLGDSFNLQGGANIHTVSSERESGFWDKFGKTHPRPPEKIMIWQQLQADGWLSIKRRLETDPAYSVRLGMKPEERLEKKYYHKNAKPRDLVIHWSALGRSHIAGVTLCRKDKNTRLSFPMGRHRAA